MLGVIPSRVQIPHPPRSEQAERPVSAIMDTGRSPSPKVGGSQNVFEIFMPWRIGVVRVGLLAFRVRCGGSWWGWLPSTVATVCRA